MAREFFVAYHSYIETLEALSDAACGRLFRACLLYSLRREEPELRGSERYIFPSMRSQIDRDIKKYEDMCAAQAKRAEKRWHASGAAGMPESAGVTNESEEETERENTNKNAPSNASEKKKAQAPGGRGCPPALEEIKAYCEERGRGVDAEHLFDHYTANGWIQGGGKPIVDWRAAVRAWEKNEARFPQRGRVSQAGTGAAPAGSEPERPLTDEYERIQAIYNAVRRGAAKSPAPDKAKGGP